MDPDPPGLPTAVVVVGVDSGDPDSGSTDTGSPVELAVDELTADVHADIQSLVDVGWHQTLAADAHVEWQLDGESWQSTPSRGYAAGSHVQLVVGIPYSTRIHYRVVLSSSDDTVTSSVFEVRTGAVPDGMPEVHVLESTPKLQDSGSHYVLAAAGFWGEYGWTLVVDRAGRVVWAHRTDHHRVTMYAKPSWDRMSLLVDENSFWGDIDNGLASHVQTLKIDGTVVADRATPGLHHSFTDTDDGALIWGAGAGVEETVLELASDGSRRTIWSCATYHLHAGIDDYCGSNTIWWNEATDTILYSSYTTETVDEIDRTTGEVVRAFGHDPGAWGFSPLESAFWWQHGANITDTGTLLLSSRLSQTDLVTVVNEYALDEKTHTLQRVWTFGADQGLYGEDMGEAQRLSGGNTVHNYGTTPRMREVTPEGVVVWDLEVDADYIGRTTMLSDLYAFAP